MEEWKEYKLGEIFDFNNGLSKGGKFFGHGYDFVSFKTVFKNHFLPNTLDDLVESSKKEREKFSVKEGDVFLTRTSETQNELAYSCVALKDYPNATYNGFTKRLRPNGKIKIDSIFSAYFFRSAIFRNQVTSMSNMVTRASLSNEMLDRMSIKIPSYDLQKTIGKILFSFDAKIQLNKRINDNLEQQAQALFKAWFVDFEPFKGEKFVESQLGMIPEGWKVGTLSDLLDIRYGKDHKKLNDGNIPVYGSGGVMRLADGILYNGESVLIPRKGTLNNVLYVNCPFWTVDTMFYSIEKVPNVAKYCHLLLSKLDLASMNSGSAVPSMTTDILNKIQVIVANQDVFRSFNECISSLYLKAKINYFFKKAKCCTTFFRSSLHFF